MRTALRVTVGRPTLSPFEKAALKYRLMQFTPQAVQRFEAFFMRNAAFEQEGIFRIAPSQDLLQGALATMELCSSRARVLGDDAAVDTFPEFLDMQIPLAVGRERELLINVVASCYKCVVGLDVLHSFLLQWPRLTLLLVLSRSAFHWVFRFFALLFILALHHCVADTTFAA